MAGAIKQGKGTTKTQPKPQKSNLPPRKQIVRDIVSTPTPKDIEDSILKGSQESLEGFRKSIGWAKK